jgi:GNAT superfamily N-acetyltransferase
MIFAALDEAATRGELLLWEDGFCRWHLRRDGAVTIREIIVLPCRRRTGLGRRLVEHVAALNPGRPLTARCPESLTGSNEFWRGLGFVKVRTCEGINEWRRDPT